MASDSLYWVKQMKSAAYGRRAPIGLPDKRRWLTALLFTVNCEKQRLYGIEPGYKWLLSAYNVVADAQRVLTTTISNQTDVK